MSGGKRFLVAPDGSAFLSYADSGGSLIAKGDPIGDRKAGERLIWDLREMADRIGQRAAFYAVGTDYLPVYLDMGLSILKIGEVAHVDLAAFSPEGAHRKGLRYAQNREARENVVFEVVPREDLSAVLPELRAVSDH